MREALPATGESFRRAAMFLANATRETRVASILLTGPQGGEGTTTVALSLASELKSSCGLRPLVVELSRARPRLCAMLGLDDERSIEALAAGSAVSACVQSTRLGFDVIPASDRKSGAPAATAIDAVLRRVAEEVRETHDLVLVDAPPLLASVDAITAGRAVPRVLLVVRGGRTRYEVVARVREELQAQNIEILGAILNGPPRPIPGWVYRMIVR